MKARRWILCAAAIFLVGIWIRFGIWKTHTCTHSDKEGTSKAEQIQPVWGTVKVCGDRDTDVIFTDVETGEQSIIGYITHGMTGKIKLERGKWYSVAGAGNLTMTPVKVRTE